MTAGVKGGHSNFKNNSKASLSSTKDIKKGIESVESIGDCKRLIEKNGVFAIEIEFVKDL